MIERAPLWHIVIGRFSLTRWPDRVERGLYRTCHMWILDTSRMTLRWDQDRSVCE
jgi:hypothetical protein